MRSPCSIAIYFATLSLLAPGMAGCRHKAAAPQPQISTAPPLQPSSITQVPLVPKLPAPAQPEVGPPGSDQKAQEAQPPPPKRPKRSRKHPVNPDVATSVAPATPAPVAPAPEPSLGQLSAGPGVDSQERAAMTKLIQMQEMRLSKLKHPLDDEDEAITRQVEVFLSKAKQAVIDNDLDGARTLTTKAKVLLDELSPS